MHVFTDSKVALRDVVTRPSKRLFSWELFELAKEQNFKSRADSGASQGNSNKRLPMNGSVIREPSRSLKEQFSRNSEAWKEQSDPIFRFWAEGD